MEFQQLPPRLFWSLNISPNQSNRTGPVVTLDPFYSVALWHVRYVYEDLLLPVNVVRILLHGALATSSFPAASNLNDVVWRVVGNRAVGTGLLRRPIGNIFGVGPPYLGVKPFPVFLRPAWSSSAVGDPAAVKTVEIWGTLIGIEPGGSQ